MKSLLMLLLVLCASLSLAADQSEPPHAINAHFSWCGQGKTNAEKLRRYEGFWKERLPENEDEYDDQPHITFVRKCAYRMAGLYALTKQPEKCLEKLKWLETHDDAFPENVK